MVRDTHLWRISEPLWGACIGGPQGTYHGLAYGTRQELDRYLAAHPGYEATPWTDQVLLLATGESVNAQLAEVWFAGDGANHGT